MKKSRVKLARDLTSSWTAFKKGNKVKKMPGLKIESDSGINSIPTIKGKLGLFELSIFRKTVCSAFFSGMSQ